jgi:ABC-type oligopeptide transport system substrate-binding subunit
MKKLFILSMAAVIALTMTACGMNVGGTSSGSGSSNTSQASKPNPDSYEDSLAGLEKYLADNSVLSGDPTEMRADFIGAKKGVRYQISFNGKNNLTIELYEYDTDNLDDTAKSVLDSVKQNGNFSIMNQQIPGVLSDSGKYLMIYKDTATGDQNQAHQKDVTALFKEFKK